MGNTSDLTKIHQKKLDSKGNLMKYFKGTTMQI